MDWNRNHLGHTHFWARPMTRRTFLGTAAIAGGAAATAGLWLPELVKADTDELATVFPLPIPGGITVPGIGVFIHHFPPFPVLGPGAINEPSQITDFNGLVGVCRVKGAGTGTDATGTHRLNYQVDNGFMSGLYVGEDGGTHHGTFAFV